MYEALRVIPTARVIGIEVSRHAVLKKLLVYEALSLLVYEALSLLVYEALSSYRASHWN